MTASPHFVLLAGRPALDLCNTRIGERDLLGSTEDLGRWFSAALAADPPPAISRRELAAARDLRDGLRPALLDADGAAVASIARDWLDGAPGRLCIESDLQPRFTPRERTSCCLLVAAVLDAVELVRDTPRRVRECANDSCAVLYLDTSRNRSRRWCSMETCGARSKAQAYYRRHRVDGLRGP
ncbi:MAG: CGNR zinc finger domain-containing protein [Thermoleophilia bacterium]